jgi:hypothetical protein
VVPALGMIGSMMIASKDTADVETVNVADEATMW